MRPVIKKSNAVFYPQGFLDGLNASTIIEASDANYTISKKPKAVFVSLKKVIFFNKKGLAILVEALRHIQDSIRCAIGFCEYDKKKYDTILSMFDDGLDFSLIENLKVLSLFFDDNIDPQKKILIYNEDTEQKNQLAIELYEIGYKPYVAKDKNDFLEKEEEFTKYGIVVSLSYIASGESKINVYIKNNIIFYTLKNFIDSSIIKTFDTKYHENLLRVGFKVFVFDITKVSSMNIHGVNFLAKLSTAGAEYGTTFCMVGVDNRKLSESLKNDLEDSGIVLYKDMEEFLSDEDIKKEAISGGRVPAKSLKLTKNIISNLNIFVDTTIHITQMLSQKTGKKVTVKIDTMNFKSYKDEMVVLFGVYGEINATFTIVITKNLLLKACKIFISDPNDKDDLKDAFVEYVNIVASKIKSNFKLYKINLETTLPRVFEEAEQAQEFFGERKGVYIELDFEGEPLRLYLSK